MTAPETCSCGKSSLQKQLFFEQIRIGTSLVALKYIRDTSLQEKVHWRDLCARMVYGGCDCFRQILDFEAELNHVPELQVQWDGLVAAVLEAIANIDCTRIDWLDKYNLAEQKLNELLVMADSIYRQEAAFAWRWNKFREKCKKPKE